MRHGREKLDGSQDPGLFAEAPAGATPQSWEPEPWQPEPQSWEPHSSGPQSWDPQPWERHPAEADPADTGHPSGPLPPLPQPDLAWREPPSGSLTPLPTDDAGYDPAPPRRSSRHAARPQETDGAPTGPDGYPTGPNGALTAITYNYAGKPCIDKGSGPTPASCGLSETPPPRPIPLPIAHVPLLVHLQIHGHLLTSANISFPAPYPVTNARQRYSVSAPTCRGGLSGSGSNADVAQGAMVRIPVGDTLSQACARSVTFKIEYVRVINDLPEPTPVGSVTITEPPGTHFAPLPRRH